MSGPAPGDWRRQANPKATPAPSGNAKQGKRAWQAQTDSPKGPRKPMSRGSKLAMAALVLSVIVGGVIAVVLWLRPAKPATLILLGASYDDNLTLPHNASAWRSIIDLEEVAGSQSIFTQAGKISLAHGPIDLRGTTWEKEWAKFPKNVKEESVVVVLGLHGSVKDGKAFLHFDDDRGQAGVAFEQVLKDLAASPLAKKNVLLVLEPALNRSNWSTGMLHNDFVRKLKEYDKQIAEQPNLLVMCASDVDQVSWDSPEWRRTIFMHYMIEGLQGGADSDHDERVTSAELFQYVHKKVQDWSQANRGVLQTPILLGKDRSESKGLVQVQAKYKERTPDEAPGKSTSLPMDDLEGAWRAVATLRDTVPAPAVYAPQLWRAFQELTLRYEQLIRAGFPAQKVSDVKARLKDMEKTIRARATLEATGPARTHNLPMSAALGVHPAWDNKELGQQFKTLWEARKGEKLPELLLEVKKWAAAQDPTLDAKDADAQLALHLMRQLLEHLAKSSNVEPGDLASTPDVKTARAREIVHKLESQLAIQRPAEAHFLVMLAQELADGAAKELPTLQLALDVRLLAEEASLGAASLRTHPYAEILFPRVRQAVDDGDAERRKGEDYLLGSTAEHFKTAEANLKKAKDSYTKARDTAKAYREALHARDRALADLPFLAQWLANQRPTLDKEADGDLATLQTKVELIAERAREIHKKLGGEADAAADLKSLTTQLAQEHLDLKAAFAKKCEKLTPEIHLQNRWHEIEAILSVPLLVEEDKDPVAVRMNLLRNSRSTSGQFHVKAVETKGPLVPQDQEAALLAKWIAREKRLARTALIPFVTFAAADDPIQKHLLQMVEGIAHGLRASLETADLAKAAEELSKAEFLCRGLPGGLEKLAPREPFTVPEALRRLRWHDLLLWQSERTRLDHWFAERESGDKVYFEPAARICIKTAQNLVQEGIQENDMRVARANSKKAAQASSQELLDKVKGFGFDEITDTTSYWTTERAFPIAWKIVPQNDPYLKPFGVAMVEVARGKSNGERKEWKFSESKDGTNEDNLIKVQLGEKEKPASKLSVQLHVRYRGQWLESKAEVMPKSPDRIDYVFPPGDKAGIAVRMDKDFTFGAIAIMLDCSGSMTEKYKNGTRFDQAANALDKLFAIIPKNTYVSLNIFIKTASDNAPKFQVLREAEEWKREHAAPLMNLVRNMGKQIDPTGASPIARGMVKALEQGFPDATRNYSGPKLLVALTDGDDNFSFGVFARSTEHNQDVKNLLTTKFRDSGVKVHVVCFLDPNSTDKDVQREARNAEEQFNVLTNKKIFDPVGRFVAQPDGDKLAKELQDSIRPRFKFVKNVELERFVGEPERELQWHPVSPGKHQLSLEGEDKIDVQLAPGERMLVTLKRRNDKKLLYERAFMRTYTDVKLAEKEVPPMLVSMFQNHQTLQDNRLHQLVSFEDLTRRSWLAHRTPEFAWIETAVHPDKSKYKQGKPPLLECYRDLLYPAPCYRLRTRGWPLNNPSEVRVWWTNEDTSGQVWSKPLDVPVKGLTAKPLEIAKTTYLIEDIAVEDHVRAPAFDETPVRKSCLVVRVQHPPGKPVRLQLTNEHEGEEHHTFSSDNEQTPGKYTAFFWGVGEGERWNLNVIALDEFKKSADSARFEPELSQAAPQAVPLK